MEGLKFAGSGRRRNCKICQIVFSLGRGERGLKTALDLRVYESEANRVESWQLVTKQLILSQLHTKKVIVNLSLESKEVINDMVTVTVKWWDKGYQSWSEQFRQHYIKYQNCH